MVAPFIVNESVKDIVKKDLKLGNRIESQLWKELRGQSCRKIAFPVPLVPGYLSLHAEGRETGIGRNPTDHSILPRPFYHQKRSGSINFQIVPGAPSASSMIRALELLDPP
jgi:hypothetical protein